MAPKRNRKQSNTTLIDYKNLRGSDVTCPLCKTILIKPITLPCNHSFCASCFDQSAMQNANFQCPICKIRIRSWLRSINKRNNNNNLINEQFWLAIQTVFPIQVHNRLNGLKADICTISGDIVVNDDYDKRKTKNISKQEEMGIIEGVPSTSTANNNNSSQLIKNNLAKKEYTCRILCQNETDNVRYFATTNNLVKKKFQQLQKIVDTDDIEDVSCDSIESECIYFRPIDYRHNPPSHKQTPIKVPTKYPTKFNLQILPPSGQKLFTINYLESAFARLLSATATTDNSKQSSTTLIISNNNNNSNNKSSTSNLVINNNNNNKRKNFNNNNNNSKVNDVSKKLKTRRDAKRNINNNNNNNKIICDIENNTINNYIKQLTDESVQKILQEKADLEFARRLQEELNQSNNYSTRSYSKRIASAKIQVLTK